MKPTPTDFEPSPISADDQFHHYRGNRIPWFVRIMWLAFWVFAVVYVIRFLFPALRVDLLGS